MTKQSTGLRCPSCGYDLTALTSSKCPECGQPFSIAKPGTPDAWPPPPSPPEPLSHVKGIFQVFFGMMFGVGEVDQRQPIWVVAVGMLAVAVLVLLVVWMGARSQL